MTEQRLLQQSQQFCLAENKVQELDKDEAEKIIQSCGTFPLLSNMTNLS